MSNTNSQTTTKRKPFIDHGEVAFEDRGILGVNYGNERNQKLKCPECHESHKTEKLGQCDLSVNVREKVYRCHRCPFKGAVGMRKLECPECGHVHERPMSHTPPFKCPECAYVGTGSGSHASAVRVDPLRATPRGTQAIEPLPANRVPRSAPDEVLYEYMSERGISRATVDRNRVTACERPFERLDGGKWGAPAWCVCFNYYRGDDLVNVKFRTLDKRFAQVGQATPIPYRLDALTGAPYAILCEGECDALSFDEVGIPYAVSTPHGAIQVGDANVDGKLRFLETAHEYFEPLERIYIATDADDHGRRTAEEYARRLGKERCFLVSYPDGCKDANDVLVKHGADALRRCIEEARPYPYEGVLTHFDEWPGTVELYEQGAPNGTLIGIPEVDNLFQLMPGQLIVTTGVPSHGKSTFVDWMLTNLMVRSGWRCGLFTPENYPTQSHRIRIAQQVIGKRFYDKLRYVNIPGNSERMSRAEMEQAGEFLRDKLFHVLLPNDRSPIDAVLDCFAYLVRMYGIRLFAIDPWNHLEQQRPAGKSETDHVGDMLVKIRAFARHTDTVGWIIAHPKKMNTYIDKDTGVEVVSIPALYDVSGSANFYNAADIGITVYRERSATGNDTTKLYVTKARSIFYGRTGEAAFRFDPTTERFYTSASPNRDSLLSQSYSTAPIFAADDWMPSVDEEPF